MKILEKGSWAQTNSKDLNFKLILFIFFKLILSMISYSIRIQTLYQNLYHILYDLEFYCKIFKTFKSLICNFFPKFPQKHHGISNPGFEGFGIA